MTDRPSRTLRPHRLLAPAPSVAAVIVLLVGSVLPATPPPLPDPAAAVFAATAVPAVPAVPAPTVELPPGSVTMLGEPGPARQKQATGSAGGRGALPESSPWSVPDVLLAAYRQAVAGAPSACHLPVSLLAAIGQVESGSLAGRSLDATHRAVPAVLGPVLDGAGTAAIPDTDGGRLDGSSRWDRAVGPMQFIPGTWAVFGVDADGDGRADPQDVYDAAAAAAGYLCDRGRDLGLAVDLRAAILAYNHSTAYLATVLAWQQRFAASGGGMLPVVNGTLNAPTNLPTRATTAAQPTSRDTGTAVGNRIATNTPSTPNTHVIVRAAAKLAFTTAPSPTATSGTALARQPVVTVQDADGNTITTDTSSVTLTLTTPSGASLTCAANPTGATSGLASFTGCTIDKAGTYTVTASDGSLTSATSSSVTITAGAPAKVTVVSGAIQSAPIGHELTGALVALVTDANANPVSGATLTFTAPNAGPSGTFANTTTTTSGLTDANGRATSSVLTANTTAGTYSLIATAGSVSATFTLTNSPGAATRFVIASAPVSGPASATAMLGPITVQLQDSYGNPVPAPTGGTPVVLSSDSSGTTAFATTRAGTSTTSVIIPGGESSVTFYYGDTLPGNPVVTASGPLISAIQAETITLAAATTDAALTRGP